MSRISPLLLLLLCAATSLATAPGATTSYVVPLTASSFTEALGRADTFVMFYAPWCKHSKDMRQAWTDLGTIFRDYTDVVIGSVDCTQEKELCSKQGASSFPTLKLYSEGDVLDYVGDRSLDSLRSFAVAHIHNKDESREGVRAQKEADRVFAANLAEAEKHGVLAVAESLFESTVFHDYSLVMFYAAWDLKSRAAMPTWILTATNFKENKEFRLISVDCAKDSTLCHRFGVSTFPTFVLFHDGKPIANYENDGPVTAPSLARFLKTRGVLPHTDERAEAEMDADVLVLNQKNFEDVVARGFTFVKFYAPWCGHCKKLQPVWGELATQFHNNKKFKIAMLNCDEESALCSAMDVKSLPTLALYHNGMKQTVYNGPRLLSSLVGFVNLNLNTREEL